MVSYRKVWLTLGGAMCSGSALSTAAWAQPGLTNSTLDMPEPQISPEMKLVSGEGGESGEGGVDIGRAAHDAATYLAAIDIIRAHYLAGLAALEIGDRESAGGMFAHPISEVYLDLEEVWNTLEVTPFEEEMLAASSLAYEDSTQEEIAQAGQLVLDALDAAEEKAPGPVTLQDHIAVILDMMNRAAAQYNYAWENPEMTEAWIDGYGFAAAAQQRLRLVRMIWTVENLSEEQQAAIETLREVQEELDRAFAQIAKPEMPPVEASALQATISRAQLTAGNL